MGAVALSRHDEEKVEILQKLLRLPSKSQVIRRALEELQQAVTRSRLALEIRESVRKCGEKDRKEYDLLAGAAFHRSQPE